MTSVTFAELLATETFVLLLLNILIFRNAKSTAMKGLGVGLALLAFVTSLVVLLLRALIGPK